MDYFHKFKQEAKERIDNLTIEEVAKWLHNTIDEKMIIEFLKKDVDNVDKNVDNVDNVDKNVDEVKRRCVLCGKIQWNNECVEDKK